MPVAIYSTVQMTPLTPTGRVILGMIALGRQTGYDIKQLVDKSTRHFWSASYGQIYPELRRLEEQGLIRGPVRAARRPGPNRLHAHPRRPCRAHASGSSPTATRRSRSATRGCSGCSSPTSAPPSSGCRTCGRCATPTSGRSTQLEALDADATHEIPPGPSPDARTRASACTGGSSTGATRPSAA